MTDDVSYLKASTHGNKGVQVDIVFSRRLLNQIITVFVPCIALCIVAFSTILYRVRDLFKHDKTLQAAFFQVEEFEAVVTVNVTVLLVLTTLFISVSNSLPRTAYIKMIEIYLIFTLFMPFCEVLLITVLDGLR